LDEAWVDESAVLTVKPNSKYYADRQCIHQTNIHAYWVFKQFSEGGKTCVQAERTVGNYHSHIISVNIEKWLAEVIPNLLAPCTVMPDNVT
jgi:hypothetical protein